MMRVTIIAVTLQLILSFGLFGQGGRVWPGNCGLPLNGSQADAIERGLKALKCAYMHETDPDCKRKIGKALADIEDASLNGRIVSDPSLPSGKAAVTNPDVKRLKDKVGAIPMMFTIL